MTMKSVRKYFLALLIALMPLSLALPQDVSSDSLNPGDVLIGASFGLGNYSGKAKRDDGFTADILSAASFGFTIPVDVVLPLGLSAGLEAGLSFQQAAFHILSLFGKYEINIGTMMMAPAAFRFGYHNNFGVKNLDVYGLAKIGYAMGFLHYKSGERSYQFEGEYINLVFDEIFRGFGWGLGLGARYFFTPNVAGFAELGYDRYALKGKVKDVEYDDYWGTPTYTPIEITAAAAKFAAIGVSYKIPARGSAGATQSASPRQTQTQTRTPQTTAPPPPSLGPSAQAAPALPPVMALPPLPPVPRYILAIGGLQYGPYEMEQMRQAVDLGSLTRNTLVWREGMAQWEVAGVLPELAHLFR